MLLDPEGNVKGFCETCNKVGLPHVVVMVVPPYGPDKTSLAVALSVQSGDVSVLVSTGVAAAPPVPEFDPPKLAAQAP